MFSRVLAVAHAATALASGGAPHREDRDPALGVFKRGLEHPRLRWAVLLAIGAAGSLTVTVDQEIAVRQGMSLKYLSASAAFTAVDAELLVATRDIQELIHPVVPQASRAPRPGADLPTIPEAPEELSLSHLGARNAEAHRAPRG